MSKCVCAPMYGPQFPMYWYSMPAILKGWMDRIFCQGFAFDFPGFFDEGFLKVCGLEGNPGGSEVSQGLPARLPVSQRRPRKPLLHKQPRSSHSMLPGEDKAQ